MAKPEKVYMANTNLLHAFASGQHEVGTVREIFALSQLCAAGHTVHAAKSGDFVIDDSLTFEIGGRHKGTKQIADVNNGFVFRDEIEQGSRNILPLWTLGFLF